MAQRRVVVLNYDIAEDGPEATALRAAGADLVFTQRQGPTWARSEEETIAACAGAWAIYGYGRLSRDVIAALPDLRFVQNPSVGYDWIDVAAATERGVAVANNPLFCREEVADHAAMLILAAARRLPKQVHRLDADGWDTRAGYAEMGDTPRVHGSTLGFIAFGAIARLTAAKMAGFGMTYLAYDPYLPADTIRQHGAEPVTLDELCRRSDVLTMHALLNEETRGMLRAEHFRQMKPTAWIVNTSRGATIHEASLIQALREGWIGGACLDVVEKEPAAPDNPLLTMPN
ncbi:MAG: C-terminal binding protein, partial [Chloroflexi bacterium]|nr:C-terminal binding protein [Chloroflexota bacterium]